MKDIIGFENLYAITENGQVWSYYSNQFLSATLGNNGYLKVTLVKDHKKYTKMIHRLVAEAYIENPENYPLVNHKDENKCNNNINNLEWCSYKYNSNYGSNPNKSKERMENFLKEHPLFNRGENNHKSISVRCVETQQVFETFSAAAEWCGIKDTASFTDYFKGKQGSVGKHPLTKERLHWQKFENDQWHNPPTYSYKTKHYSQERKVRCITTGEIFETITEAQEFYHITHIGECCRGTRKTAGGKQWEYADAGAI